MWAIPRTTSLMIDWVSCMHIFVNKENSFVLRLLLKDWNYFWNKYCNLPFSAICHSQFPFLIFAPSSWYQKERKLRCERACGKIKYLVNKKTYWRKNYYNFKGLYKTTCYKTKSNFSQFFYSHWLFYECFFFFPYKSVCKISKVNKISSSSFYYM